MKITTGFGKQGQGSFLSGDLPSIILIVLSVGFFLSAIYMTIDRIDKSKGPLDLQAAATDASSIFLKENAKISASDLDAFTSGFVAASIDDTEKTYRVKTFVELISLSDSPGSPCKSAGECIYGERPDQLRDEIISKRFPIALRGDTDLDVFPALVTVAVYRKK